jgi:hypothetical protein
LICFGIYSSAPACARTSSSGPFERSILFAVQGLPTTWCDRIPSRSADPEELL